MCVWSHERHMYNQFRSCVHSILNVENSDSNTFFQCDRFAKAHV